MVKDVMVKHCKDFFRQHPLFLIVRLTLIMIALSAMGVCLDDFIRASHHGWWFLAAFTGLGVLVNVATVLLSLAIKLPFQRPQIRVEIRMAMMPVCPPLPADDPLVTDEKNHCCICEQGFKAGEVTTLVSKERPEIGKAVEAFPAHAECMARNMTEEK